MLFIGTWKLWFRILAELSDMMYTEMEWTGTGSEISIKRVPEASS